MTHSDFSGALFREAVNARADCRESDALDVQLEGNVQDFGVTRCKQSVFIGLATAPDRADGVNDVLGGEIVTFGVFCGASFAAAESTALF